MKIMQICAVDITMHKLLRRLNTEIINESYELICVCSKGKHSDKLINDGFDMRFINIDRKISLFNNINSLFSLYKLMKKEKPDIVHVHTPVASVLGRIAAKLAGVDNIIYTAHGFYFHDGMSKLKYKFFYYIEKIVGRFFTDYIFTQSEEDFDLALNDGFLKDKNKFRHISNGIDLDNNFNIEKLKLTEIDHLRDEFGISDEDIIVTFIGRLVKEKGINDLIEAFKQLANKNIKLLVIGSIENKSRDNVTINEITKFKSENIIFTGYRENINELLYVSDIFCLPSYREGMPRSIIEAMSMKNAIIATNIRGCREEVENGENGLLVSVENPIEIRESIETLCNNSDLLKSMKEKAFNKAHRKYNERDVVEEQLKVFRICKKRS